MWELTAYDGCSHPESEHRWRRGARGLSAPRFRDQEDAEGPAVSLGKSSSEKGGGERGCSGQVGKARLEEE